jgi:single-strand DNA-binding protein
MVIGEVKVSAYTDKAGQPAATLEITANDIRLLGSRDDAGGSESGEQGGGGYQDDDFTPRGNRGGNRGGGGGRNNSGGDIDDIPF